MKTISLTEFKKNTKQYFDDVSRFSEILIVQNGVEEDDAIVVMSIKEYNAIKETEHILSTKANRIRLAESMRQLEEVK